MRDQSAIDTNQRLLMLGRQLEMITLMWNVAGVFVLAFAAMAARSVALAGFGLDSVIEIGASLVVIWELADVAQTRQLKAIKMIGLSFIALSIYLAAQSTVVLALRIRAHRSPVGIGWTAATAFVMFALALGKSRVGRSLNNPVIRAEGRVTLIDGILATAVLLGLMLNAFVGWWWADPITGYLILYYAMQEARSALKH